MHVNMEPNLIEDELLVEDKIDLRRYYRAVLRRWWLVLLIALAVSVPWALYLKSQPPLYEAEVLIRFSDGDDADVQRRRTEIRSRSFAERVVARLGLAMRFELDRENWINRNQVFEEFSTSTEPVPGHYVLKLTDAETYELYLRDEEDPERLHLVKQGLVAEAVEQSVTVNGFTFRLVENGLKAPVEVPFEIRPFRKAVKSFQNRININTDRSGTLMSVKLTDNDPNLVAEMTNHLAELFLEHTFRLRNEGITSRRQTLEEQLSLAQNELEEADRRLKEFKERYATYLTPNAQTHTNDLASAQAEESRLRQIINTLQGLLAKKQEAALLTNGDGQDTEKSSARFAMLQIVRLKVFDDDPNMLILRQQLGDWEEQWDRVVSVYSPANPKAKEALTEILKLHRQIEAAARKKLQELNQELAVVLQEKSSLERKLRQLPEQQRQLSELERNHKVLERKYLDLLGRYQQAKIDEAVQSRDAEILDSAVVPEFPTNRDKKRNAAFGGILGLMLGVGVVLGMELLDKSIKTVDDVKRTLKLNVLGTIPQIDFSEVYDFQDSEKIKQIDQQLVTHDYSPTPVGEAYRSLRTNLMFSEKHGKLQSLVITSNEPGDGKSFTAANLAITLAQLKTNTLLIDSDLRRGVLHNTFGVSKEPGFSNYLTTAMPLASILKETHIPNLTLISCGSLIPNPSELLGSHQMRRFLDEVRRKFELVIFDSPPLNAATDAVVIGTQVDGVVIVIRAGKTDRDVARQKLELFNQVPARLLGAVLNGTTADMAHPGYSYYHY